MDAAIEHRVVVSEGLGFGTDQGFEIAELMAPAPEGSLAVIAHGPLVDAVTDHQPMELYRNQEKFGHRLGSRIREKSCQSERVSTSRVPAVTSSRARAPAWRPLAIASMSNTAPRIFGVWVGTV